MPNAFALGHNYQPKIYINKSKYSQRSERQEIDGCPSKEVKNHISALCQLPSVDLESGPE